MYNQLFKIALAAGIGLALALTFSCSNDDNQGGNGGSPNNLCNGVSYDPSTYRCELGELIGKCRGIDYYVAYERCVDGVVVDNNSNNKSSSSSVVLNSSSSLATTSSTFTDTRDGKTYRIETFVSYTWMIEDLRFGSGTYNQNDALTACPYGWHLPNNNELSILQNNFGNGSNFISSDYWWRTDGLWYVNNGRISTVNCGKDLNSSYCKNSLFSGACESTDPCGGSLSNKKYGIRCVKDLSAIPSSSSVKVSSSSSKPSSSSSIVQSSSSVVVSSSSSKPSSSSSSIEIEIIYGTPVTYDGETYETVVIGTQTWFQRNLNSPVEGSKCGIGSAGNNGTLSDANTTYCDTYGRLYQWVTAMTVCPPGWHLPSDAEWTILTDFVGSNAGTKLKANSALWSSNIGTDTYGFAALPGGYGHNDGKDFVSIGSTGYWWTATSAIANYAYSRDMHGNLSIVLGGGSSVSAKSDLYSVRCVQD